MAEYPKPRYPRLKRPKSVEELLPKARALLSEERQVSYNALRASYEIKSGNKVLFVVLSEYHPMVVEAMCLAIRERGARVDVFSLDSTPVAPPKELATHEAISLDLTESDGYNYFYTVICDHIRTATAVGLAKSEKYDLVITGCAGAPPLVDFRVRRFNFPALEDWAGRAIDTPMELLEALDQKVFDQVMSCQTMRLTDPEGTDLKWTNYQDGRPILSDHIFAKPFFIGRGFGGKDDAYGVVAGTTNHLGAFPLIKVNIEGGQVVKITGGGKYGEIWREKLKKYKDIKLPPLSAGKGMGLALEGEAPMFEISDPGLFWHFEMAIGTIPGVFRLPKQARFECYANMLHERRRSGWIHHGFGPPALGMQQLIRARLPWTHVHVHSIFGTLVGHTDKGETVTIVDKGHLTALDDPEVRSIAKKYGNPDELLSEAWIPAVPGINVPGNYVNDYAQDPVAWIMHESAEHPVWVD
ncbi:MAG: hypothetical protein WCO26_01755 [Deltaproteobacteria bacterium]